MKLFRYILFLSISTLTHVSFADNIIWIEDSKLKKWNITLSDIPKAIQSATTFILWLAATIAVVMIIVWALKYSLGSVSWSSPNKQNAVNTITFWILGFVLSISAWFIINLVIANL